jgi:hypothetical protein
MPLNLKVQGRGSERVNFTGEVTLICQVTIENGRVVECRPHPEIDYRFKTDSREGTFHLAASGPWLKAKRDYDYEQQELGWIAGAPSGSPVKSGEDGFSKGDKVELTKPVPITANGTLIGETVMPGAVGIVMSDHIGCVGHDRLYTILVSSEGPCFYASSDSFKLVPPSESTCVEKKQ